MFARIYLEEKDDKVVSTKVYNNKMVYPTTAQKMKFSIKDFCSKYDKICSFLWI